MIEAKSPALKALTALRGYGRDRPRVRWRFLSVRERGCGGCANRFSGSFKDRAITLFDRKFDWVVEVLSCSR